MRKVYGLINSETGTIVGVTRPDKNSPVVKPNYVNLKPNMIEVELLEDDRGNVVYDGDIPTLVKEHNWKRVKADRETIAVQDITVGGIDFCVDHKAFEAMKDLVSVLDPEQDVKWKAKDGKRHLVSREQLQEVIKEYIEARQDSYEASWEVEDDLSNGSDYTSSKAVFSEKLANRRASRKSKK